MSYMKKVLLRKSQSGLSIVELMIAVGLIAVVSVAMLTMMNNLFKGVASAQKSANRTDAMKALSTVFANKETCKTSMGAGTLAIPTTWSTGSSNAIDINKIQIGSEVLAEVGRVINDIQVVSMKLEMVSGPYQVQYNIAPAGSTPDIRNYKRYFTKLTVVPQKSGGAANNVGGDSLKSSEFRLALLVNDANTLHDCFGGMDEADVAALCEKAFEGQYDPTRFPWCTPLQLSVGIHKSDLTAEYPRFAVLEKQNATNPLWDLTMALYGNGTGASNGPALWFARDRSTPISLVGNLAAIGYANRVNAYTNGSKPGDLIITNRSATGDLEVGTLDVHLKMSQATKNATIDRGLTISAVGSNTSSSHPLTVNAPDGQGRIVIAGTSDAGETFSALYLSDANAVNPLANSWVLAHKAATSGSLDSFHINRWSGGTMLAGMSITPALNMGIGTLNPAEKLEVAGNVLVSGTIRGVGNATFGSNVTVAGTVTAASDVRLKKNIHALDQSLEKVLLLEPVFFQWRDPKLSSKKQIGFIAQDLEKVVPEVVVTSEAGMKSVAYANLVAVAIGAIKEIYQKMMALVSAAEHSETRLLDLEKKIELMAKKQQELEIKNSILEKQILSCEH